MCHCYEYIPEGVLVQVGGVTPGLTLCPPWPIGGVHPVGGVTPDLTLCPWPVGGVHPVGGVTPGLIVCPLWTTEMTAGDIAAGSTPYLGIPPSLPPHPLPCCWPLPDKDGPVGMHDTSLCCSVQWWRTFCLKLHLLLWHLAESTNS